MDPSEACDSNRWSRRRHENKRRRVEAAVEKMILLYELAPETGKALSEGIYGLYRNLVAQKTLDDQDRHYRQRQSRAEHEHAVRTAIASDADGPAYVADAREFAAHMIRLERLEQRNVGRGKAIEQASKVTWVNLSPQEKRKARLYLARNVLPGDKTRQPAREVTFLTAVAGLIEEATGAPIRFSSTPDVGLTNGRRHHGAEFDVMIAAAVMADYRLSNEAMAQRIRRIRR